MGVFGSAIIVTYCTIAQVVSGLCIVWYYSLCPVHVRRCSRILAWTELCLLRNIDLFISQLAPACFSHISLQAVNHSDMRLWHPFSSTNQEAHWQGLSLLGMRSSGLRQPRRPAAGGWALGWSACSQGFGWFMLAMLFGSVLKTGGLGRIYWSVHCVAHRAAS